jgi:two-component system, LytTR family, response regulator LytT
MFEKKISCIAVDDEPLALALVSKFIEQTQFLSLEGKFENAIEALNYLNKNSVDLIFMDIQMPDLTGMELARILHGKASHKQPKIIFTTAYDQFAIEGYKVSALDYLLKPYSYEDFLKASTKACQTSEIPGSDEIENKHPYIFLKVEYQLQKIFLSEIVCVEGYKDYVKVHLTDKPNPILSLTSLKNMEEILPKDQFMRIHRSFIISLDQIQSVTRNNVNLGNINITVSDHYKDNFLKFMEKWMN